MTDAPSIPEVTLADELADRIRDLFKRNSIEGCITGPLSDGKRYIVLPYDDYETHLRNRQERGRQAALRTPHPVAAEGLIEREAAKHLDAVLASSGARGRYHALEYAEAVEAAEAFLARPPVAAPGEVGLREADEPLSEADCLRELGLLYNYRDTDEPQFTRWNMLVAISHGKRLAEEALRTALKDHPTDGGRDGQG